MLDCEFGSIIVLLDGVVRLYVHIILKKTFDYEWGLMVILLDVGYVLVWMFVRLDVHAVLFSKFLIILPFLKKYIANVNES